MRIKLDENLPASAAPPLQALGHEVDSAAAERLAGTDDAELLAATTRDGRLLVTMARGLGDVRRFPPGSHGGVLVIRLGHQSPRAVASAVSQLGATVDSQSSAAASASGVRVAFASVVPNRDVGGTSSCWADVEPDIDGVQAMSRALPTSRCA